MQVELSQSTVTAAFSSFGEGIQWLGHSVSDLGSTAWTGIKNAAAAVAVGVATAWAAAKPVLGKIGDFVISPYGAGIALTALSGVLVSLSSRETDDIKRAAMQGAGVCSALVAGLVVGKFAL